MNAKSRFSHDAAKSIKYPVYSYLVKGNFQVPKSFDSVDSFGFGRQASFLSKTVDSQAASFLSPLTANDGFHSSVSVILELLYNCTTKGVICS